MSKGEEEEAVVEKEVREVGRLGLAVAYPAASTAFWAYST